jgi:GNAT superfamily N-acetyltransferase
MSTEVMPTTLDTVLPLRELHREEMNCQIVHDSFPARGLSDPFLLQVDGQTAGYGFIANRFPPNTVDEFFVLPEYRGEALPLFRELVAVSGATKVRAQTNDRLLLLMLYDCGRRISSDTILFADAFTSALTCPDGVFRHMTNAEMAEVFKHHHEPVGDWVIESDGRVVGTGGMLFHYNPPYGDLFMEVAEPYRLRGFGSYLIQELKRVCYEMGKVPAARCNVKNVASRRTLQRAGMLPCGRILLADIAK